MIPDECVVTVNYRFAPDRTVAEAEAHLAEVFDGYDVRTVRRRRGRPARAGPAGRAGLRRPRWAASRWPKYGWTDVARFSALGIPAVNFGPGDPALAHTREEHVPIAQVESCEQRMRAWLLG